MKQIFQPLLLILLLLFSGTAAAQTVVDPEGPGPDPTTAKSIQVTAGTGGTISPSGIGGKVSVPLGADQSFRITPNPGFTVGEVKVDGVSKGALSSYTFRNVQTHATLEATFTGQKYTVTFPPEEEQGSLRVTDKDGQAITSGSQLASNTELRLKATPKAGYASAGFTADGIKLPGSTLTLTRNVTLKALFEKATHKATVTTVTGGTLTVTRGTTSLLPGIHSLEEGTVLTLSHQAATGYTFDTYTVSPQAMLADDKVTVTGDVKIGAAFTAQTYELDVTAPTEGRLTIDGAPAVTGKTRHPFGKELLLSNTPPTGKAFEAYVVSPAAALSGNKLKMTGATTLAVRFKEGGGQTTDPEGNTLYTITFAAPLIVKEGDKTLASGAKVKASTPLTLLVPVTNTERLTALTANGNKVEVLTLGSLHSATYALKSNTTFTATLRKNTFPVDLRFSEGGTLQATAGGAAVVAGTEYVYGTEISVTATPAKGYTLTRILAGSRDITLSRRTTLTEELLLSAVFTAQGTIQPNPDPGNPDPDAPAGIDLTTQQVVYNRSVHSFVLRTAPGGILDNVTLTYSRDGKSAQPKEAGLYDVRLTRPADDRFAALDQTVPGGLQILQATVVVTKVDYAQEQLVGSVVQTMATLNGGEAEYLSVKVPGTFSWLDTEGQQLTATESGYRKVRFTPSDPVNFLPATAQVHIQVGATPAPTHTVRVKTEGTGSVILRSGDLTYPASGPFYNGMNLTLQAVTSEGNRFKGYQIKGVTYITNPYELEVKEDLEVTALFGSLQDPEEPANLTVTVTPPAQAIYDGRAKLVAVSSVPALIGWQVTYLDAENKPVIPVNAGTYQVEVTRPADAIWQAFRRSSTLTIGKATPAIVTPPAVGELLKGALLDDADLTGGVAEAPLYGFVPGSFRWQEPETKVESEGQHTILFTPSDTRNFYSVTDQVEVKVLSLPSWPPVVITYAQPSGGTLTVTDEKDGTSIRSGSSIPGGTEIHITALPYSSYKLSRLKIGNTDYTAQAIEGKGTIVRAMSVSRLIAATFTRITPPDPGTDPGPDPDPTPTPDPDPNPGEPGNPDPNPGNPDPGDPDNPDPNPGDNTTTYTVWVRSSGLGTVSPTTCQVKEGESLTFTITPGYSQQLVDVRLGGNSVGAVTEYRLNNIREDATIEAVFSQPGIPVYTLTSRVVGKGGIVTPTVVRVSRGSNHRFLTHLAGKGQLADLQVGTDKSLRSLGTPTSYLFTQVQADSLLIATFALPTAIEGIPATGRIYAANGYVYAEPLTDTAYLRIYTPAGVLILQRKLTAHACITTLPEGIYIVELLENGIASRKKIGVRK